MKAGVCGKHTPGGGSRGGGDRCACVWPRASAQQSPSHLKAHARQGGCEIPPPLKDQNAHRFGNTSKARSRASNEQARTPKLATNRCRRTIPCRRPCRNKYPHTAPQTRHRRPPRGAARCRAEAEPLADFQRERPAVPRTSCLSETRRVPSPSPCPWPAFRPRSGRARAAQPPQHRHDEEIGATAAGGGGHRGAAALRQRAAPSHGSRLLDGGRKGAAPQRRAGRLPARPVPVGGRPRRRDQGDGWLALGSDPLPPQPHDLRWRRRHRHWRGRECTWLCCSAAGWPSLPGA